MSLQNWNKENLQHFWRNIADRKHLVQVYENEQVFIDSLEGFVGSGFIAGDTVMVIATKQHLKALDRRLINQDFNMGALVLSERYICFDADETLKSFLLNGEIDKQVFISTFLDTIKKLERHPRRIRIFGEMVSLLWQQGLHDLSLQLENLWNDLMQKHAFTLFCAYPQSAFGSETDKLERVCCLHETVIAGSPHASTEVYYKPAI